MRLAIPKEKLYLSKGINPLVHGVIYFSVNSEHFPDNSWDDFAVKILGWWIQNLEKLMQESEEETTILFFMDGPYEIQVSKLDNDICKVDFRKRANKEQFNSFFVTKINIKNLLKLVADVAQVVLLTCAEQGWDTADVQKLKQICADYSSRLT